MPGVGSGAGARRVRRPARGGALAGAYGTAGARLRGAEPRRLDPRHRRRHGGGARRALPRPRPALSDRPGGRAEAERSEEHTSELQSLMRISYAVFRLQKKQKNKISTAILIRQLVILSNSHHNL